MKRLLWKWKWLPYFLPALLIFFSPIIEYINGMRGMELVEAGLTCFGFGLVVLWLGAWSAWLLE